jgi:hypothetical protein
MHLPNQPDPIPQLNRAQLPTFPLAIPSLLTPHLWSLHYLLPPSPAPPRQLLYYL